MDIVTNRRIIENLVDYGCIDTLRILFRNTRRCLIPDRWIYDTAILKNNIRLFEVLLEQDGSVTSGLVNTVFFFGRDTFLDRCVQLGKLDPATWRARQGFTLLHTALSWCFNDTGHYPNMFQLVVSYVEERGLDPNAIDNHGQTALHMAVYLANERAVRGVVNALLLELDPSVLTSASETALKMAKQRNVSSWRLRTYERIARFLEAKIKEVETRDLETYAYPLK